MDKVKIMEEIAKCWNEYDINYAIGHGIENYPLSIGRDVDVFIDKRYLKDAIFLATEKLFERNFLVSVPIKDPWGKRSIFAFSEDCQIQIDFFHNGLVWGPLKIVDKIEVTYQIGPFKVDPAISWAKRVLIKILGDEIPTEPLLYSYEEEFIKKRYLHFFGRKLLKKLLEILKNQDTENLKILIPSLRRAALIHGFLYYPLKGLWESLKWFWKELRPYLYQNLSPIVAIVGPDGVGKTTLIQKVQFENSFFFSPKIRHWRPAILPRLGDLIKNNQELNFTQKNLSPRRKPGKGYWLRLFYYVIDFYIGRFRDNFVANTLKPIIYDRYFLDSYVDPVRYGFSSNRGIKLLYHLLPKPDLVILLYDEPKHIHERKPELPVEEIERQLNLWLKLAAEGYVDVILPVDRPPEELAKDVEFLIMETFFEKHQSRSSFSVDRELVWLKQALCASSDRDTNKPKDGLLHLALPDGRGYLLPLNSRKASVMGLSLYSPQKSKAKLLKGLLKVGLRSGIAQCLLPKVNLDLRELEEHLAEVFGERNLSLAVSLGTPGPHRKPVIQVMNQEGKVLGYVKVGWNEISRKLVNNEYEILQMLQKAELSHLHTPEIIWFGEWYNNIMLVTKPLISIDGRNFGANALLNALASGIFHDLAQIGKDKQTFHLSLFWSEIKGRLNIINDGLSSYQRNILWKSVSVLEHELGKMEFLFILCLGDVTPWNAFVDHKGHIYVVDLENARKFWLPGWDLFHLVHSSWNSCSWTKESYVLEAIEKCLKSINIPRHLIEALYLAYLLDLYTDWCLAWHIFGQPKSSVAILAFQHLEKEIAFWTIKILKKGRKIWT